MRNPRRVPKTRPHRHISPRSLQDKMSEIISLRERLAQAELQAGQVPTHLKEHAQPQSTFHKAERAKNHESVG